MSSTRPDRPAPAPQGGPASGGAAEQAIQRILTSQCRAALAMFRDAVARCPESLWLDAAPINAYWQIAYHTLHFTHLYLQPRLDAFQPWDRHQGRVQHEDGIAGTADPASPLPLIPDPYTRADVLEYCAWCDERIERWVGALDLGSPESGFPWYRMSKLEHQFVNLRHLQHHTAQLADRLRAATGGGIRWVGARAPRADR